MVKWGESRSRSRRGGVSENQIAGAAAARLFFLTAVAIADSDETFQISRNLSLEHVEFVCLLDSQLCTDVTLFERVFCPPFVSGVKGIGFLLAMCKRVLDTACKIEKIPENKRVLHAVIKYLLAHDEI
jgi:hypothetical protein